MLKLHFDAAMIGVISEQYASDQIWFGKFSLGPHPASEITRRATEFALFCIAWNTQRAVNPSNPPSDSEFERFSDLIESGKWSTQSEYGEEKQIVEAPVFFPGGAISWQYAESE